MKTLDRYIAKLYLTNVIALLVILACFVVTIDFALNVDRFVGRAQEIAVEQGQEPSSLRTGVVTVLLVADLWWPRLLQLFSFVLGLILGGVAQFNLRVALRISKGDWTYLFQNIVSQILVVLLALIVFTAVSRFVRDWRQRSRGGPAGADPDPTQAEPEPDERRSNA